VSGARTARARACTHAHAGAYTPRGRFSAPPRHTLPTARTAAGSWRCRAGPAPACRVPLDTVPAAGARSRPRRPRTGGRQRAPPACATDARGRPGSTARARDYLQPLLALHEAPRHARTLRLHVVHRRLLPIRAAGCHFLLLLRRARSHPPLRPAGRPGLGGGVTGHPGALRAPFQWTGDRSWAKKGVPRGPRTSHTVWRRMRASVSEHGVHRDVTAGQDSFCTNPPPPRSKKRRVVILPLD